MEKEESAAGAVGYSFVRVLCVFECDVRCVHFMNMYPYNWDSSGSLVNMVHSWRREPKQSDCQLDLHIVRHTGNRQIEE